MDPLGLLVSFAGVISLFQMAEQPMARFQTSGFFFPITILNQLLGMIPSPGWTHPAKSCREIASPNG